MRERGLDDGLDPLEALRQRNPPEGDERRVDVRRRPEDRAGDRVEAGAAGGELHEHRDGAVRLRRRLGEEAVGDLPLHHHAPELDARQPGQALGDDRRRDVVRQVRDELRRRRLERGEVERERVAPVELDVRELFQLPEVRRERAVELDGVDVAHTVREVAGQDAEAGADLERDVLGGELGEPADHVEDVSVREEVLAQPLLRDHGHGLTAARRRRSRWRRSAPRARRRPRRERSASAATVWTTWAGSFGLPRSGCGARYGLSVSARIRSAGTARSSLAQLRRLRVGHVAGEGEVPAALEPGGEQARLGEAVHDHGSVVPAEDRCGVVVRLARVDHDREPELARELELGLEEPALLVLRLAAVVVVEARLADRDRLRTVEQLAQLADAVRLLAGRLVRVDPERREDAVVLLGDRERSAAGLDSRPDRDHARHPHLVCPRDRCARLLERVEVRVGVDHAAVTRGSERRSAGRAARRLDPRDRRRPSVRHLLPADVVRLAERSQDSRRRVGQVRGQSDRRDAHAVRELVESPVQVGLALGILRELPRLVLLDVAVETADVVPDRLERSGDVEAVESGGDVVVHRPRGGRELALVVGRLPQLAVSVAGDHRRRAREQVAEVVAELALVALAEAVERDVAVLAERDDASRPEADGVDAVLVDQVERVEHVPERLRDLAIVEVEVAVHEQLLRHLVPGREQERGPVDAVEAEDVLRQQVPRGPEAAGRRPGRSSARSGS